MLLEVLADAERPPGAGQHDAPHGRVVRRPRGPSSSSASLVAMSRLFIASGRFSVIVATPSATSSSTGAWGGRSWARSLPDRVAQASRQACDEPVAARLQPGRPRSAKSSAAARPGQSSGSSASGSPGSANRNLRHSWTSRKRAANAPSSSSSWASSCPAIEVVGGAHATPAYAARRPGEVPRLGGLAGRTSWARAVRTVAPARSRTSASSVRGERADPDVVGQLRVADEGQVRPAAASRARPLRARVDERRRCQAAVPGRLGCAVDPVGGLVEAVVGPVGRAVAAPAGSRTGSSQPCTDHPRDRGADGRGGDVDRGEHAVPARPPGPGCRGRAGGRRTRRRGRTGHARDGVCQHAPLDRVHGSGPGLGGAVDPIRPHRDNGRA